MRYRKLGLTGGFDGPIQRDRSQRSVHIAKFVRDLGEEVSGWFTQVLMTCDRLGLIDKKLFAIDGVKLPGNASKERSDTHAQLLQEQRDRP